MKSTLEELMKSTLPSDQTAMYKSADPSLKLKVLSDHWISKSKEPSIPVTPVVQPEDPSLEIQHSIPTGSRVRRPTNKVMPQRKDLKATLGLNHSYVDRPENSDFLPVKRSNSRKLRYENGSTQSNRSRLLSKKDNTKPTAEEIKATEQEVDRMLQPSTSSQFKVPSPSKAPSTPTKTTGTPTKILSTPTKTLSSPTKSPSHVMNSPLKSRKSQLKSKVPTRKPVQTESLSMPTLIQDQTLELDKVKNIVNDEQKLKSIAEPIANVAANVTTKELENFMANDELLNNLLNMVDEVSNLEHDKPKSDEKAPPSNCSSRLAIDDEVVEDDVPNLSTDLSSPIIQHSDPELPEPEIAANPEPEVVPDPEPEVTPDPEPEVEPVLEPMSEKETEKSNETTPTKEPQIDGKIPFCSRFFF